MRNRYLFAVVTLLVLWTCRPAHAQQRPGGSSTVLMTPTAWSLPKGEGYLKGNGVIIPSGQVGVTDRLSLGAVVPYVAVLFTPKYQFFRGASSAGAAGLIHGQGTWESGHAGMGYVVASTANETSSVSAGLGLTYSDRVGMPVVMLAAEQLTAGRARFIASAYLTKHGGLASAGVHITGRKWGAELGVMVPVFSGHVSPSPVVNIIRKFGN